MDKTRSDHGPWRPAQGVPSVRRAAWSDLIAALSAGWTDFRRAPLIGLLVGGLYGLGGLTLLGLLELREYRGLTFPLIAGFALIGPFCGTILYEMSRRMEHGGRLDWRDVPSMIAATARKQILYHGFILMFWLAVWSRVGLVIYYTHFGLTPMPVWEVIGELLTTPRGWSFLIVGHLFGAVFAGVAYSLSVLAFPFLLDRDADFITAMVMSFQAVLSSPVVMLAWGGAIGVMLAIAALPLFAGLTIVLPVLGHASWHLYRRLVIDG